VSAPRPTSATKVAIYHRVSTLDQDPTLAREELRSAAAARGMEVVLDVEETGSGARNDRPGLRRVLDAARRGQVGAVLVWKLDRAGRSALDLLSNIRTLQDAGVRFIVATQGIDMRPGGDAVSSLLLTVLAGVSEFERELIRERTRLGLAKARSKGTKLGRPARGPDVRDVVRLRASGASWSAVAKSLGCTPSAARRAATRLAGKGVPETGRQVAAITRSR
jgi:DNA invertase Pin-like site-specific DNA recombinase